MDDPIHLAWNYPFKVPLDSLKIFAHLIVYKKWSDYRQNELRLLWL